MSYAKKIDVNQPEIVAALRRIGCKVAVTSSAGAGFPDLVVYSPILRRTFLIEVKDGNKPPSAQKLTKAQEKFHDEWKECPDLHVVNSTEAAISLVRVA